MRLSYGSVRSGNKQLHIGTDPVAFRGRCSHILDELKWRRRRVRNQNTMPIDLTLRV